MNASTTAETVANAGGASNAVGTSNAIRVRAPIGEVWKALTTPDLIRQWFFGVQTEGEWRVGGRIVHRGEFQGKPYVDKGEILEFAPPRRLVMTHWSAVSGRPDEPENHEIVTWVLVERERGTELTVTEVNLPSHAAATTSNEAWTAALRSLKDLVEG